MARTENHTAQQTAQRGVATGYFALFALLVALYTLTNAGRIHTLHEAATFAVTDSLVLRGEVNTNALAWAQWVSVPGEPIGAFGELGNVYSLQNPAPALVAAPWYWLLRGFARLNMEIGVLQGVLLWNGILTAATALLLWNTTTRLGYAQQVGCGVGLLFGVGTMAWPYANLFNGEPLSALALLLCFWGLMTWRQGGRNRFAFVGGVGAALAIATVTSHGAIVAALALLALVSMVRHGVPVPEYARTPKPIPAADADPPEGNSPAEDAADDSGLATLRFGIQVGLFLGPIMLAILFIFTYNAVRFGSGFDSGFDSSVAMADGYGFSTPILEGTWGLLFSPYRGLFLYNPLLVLALVGLPFFFRRHRLEATSIVAGSAVLIGLSAMWWMWWSGFTWGPRLLAPFVPLWVLLLAPLLAVSMGRAKGAMGGSADPSGTRSSRMRLPGAWRVRPVGWIVLVFAAGSVLVQVGAVSANFVNYEIELWSRYPGDWADPLVAGPPATALSSFADSPVFGQFDLLLTRQADNLDLAWLWPDGDVRWLVVLIGGAVVLTALLILGLWLIRNAPGGAWAPSGPLVWLLVVLPALLIAVWLGEASRHPHYGVHGAGYRAIVDEICADADTDDVIITVAPAAYHIPMNWLGAECSAQPHILGYAANSLEHPETELALTRALEDHRRVWFVTGGLAPNDPDNTLERRLSETAHKAQDTWYDEYRLLLYGSAQVLNEAPWFPIATPLVGRGTSQIVVLAARMPDVVQAGDVLATEIYYELGAPSPNNLRWFVQLLAESGEPVALLDTAPQDGYASFVDLPAEQEVMERAGIWVPPDTPTGDYSLIAGLYNPDDPEAARLRAPNGNDHVMMGVVRVVGEQD